MAAALTATPSECVVGTPVLIEGTGFAVSTPFTLEIENPEENMDVTVTGESSGGGAVTSDGLVTMVPQAPGVYTFAVVCGSDELSVNVNVAES